MPDQHDRVSIKVSEDTWQRIRALERPGDTYDEIITAALNAYEQSEDVDEQQFRDWVTGRDKVRC